MSLNPNSAILDLKKYLTSLELRYLISKIKGLFFSYIYLLFARLEIQ